MNQQILSQDEVDALLQGITGESQKLEQEEVPSGGVRDYNLASQERIVRGRMPTMEIINERFARNVRIGLFNFIRKSPEISIGPIKVQKYSAFLREIVVPTNFNIVSVRPLRGSGLIVCDPTLVFAVLGRARINGKLTPEAEDQFLGGLITHWALKNALDTASSLRLASNRQVARQHPVAAPRETRQQFSRRHCGRHQNNSSSSPGASGTCPFRPTLDAGSSRTPRP